VIGTYWLQEGEAVDFFEVINKRYSVRSFDPRPVEEDKLIKVLEAGRLAPSAVNYQPRRFVVITDPELKEAIGQAYPREWFKAAPVIIAVVGDHSVSWKRKDGKDHCDIDVAIAVDHMTLAATALGLGTCWVCAFDAAHCAKVLQLPEHLEVSVLLPLGYPAQGAQPERRRLELEDVVSWNELPKPRS
jgi:nitroreductase